MDILNWIYLVKNKLRKTTVQNPDKDLVILGADVGFSKRGDGYLSYGMHVTDFAKYINESAAGNCPIQMHFKPGSIGEKVSFRKESGSAPATNKDVIIPGKLEITRGANGNGIYNIAVESNFNYSVSPQNTFWNTQYVDAANTSWASLGNIQDRTYDGWRDAIATPSGSSAPPQYVGMPVVMKWDNILDEPRYWLIMFTEWGVGQYGEYGFAYDRYEILPAVEFSQPSATNTNTPNLIDIISDGVHITRGYQGMSWGGGGAIYNTVTDPYAAPGATPRDTRWNSIYTDSRVGYSGYSDLSNLESRVYTDFANALDYAVGQNVLDTDLIMHDMTTDLYYKVNFDSWAQGGGNGAYPGGVKTFLYSLPLPGQYPDGTYFIDGVGGSGEGVVALVEINGGGLDNIYIGTNGYGETGQNYLVGDTITLAYPGVTNPIIITVTDIYALGGFSYTRTVIPQSCGVKFADGTVMNTAVTAGGAVGTKMVYTQGLLSPQVQSDFILLPDTITDQNGTTYYTYKLGGIAAFNAVGTSAYSYLIGVISPPTTGLLWTLRLINDASVIGASVNTFNQVSGKFAVNALVQDASTGDAIPLTFATIVLDNTIAGPDDYFVSIVATAGAPWGGLANIDIEFMSDQILSYYN